MTATLSRIAWSQELVWSPAHEVGVREPFGTLVAEVDNPSLAHHMVELNAVAYRSGFWKISTYDRGDKELLHSGRETNQYEAMTHATEVLVGLLDRRS